MGKFRAAPEAPERNTITRAAAGHPAVPKSRQSGNPAGLPDGILQAYGDHPPGTSDLDPDLLDLLGAVPTAPKKRTAASKSTKGH